MTLGHHDNLGIYLASVHHYIKVKESATVVTSDDSDGLSCLYLVTYFHKILGILGIYSLKTVVMSYDNHIAMT